MWLNFNIAEETSASPTGATPPTYRPIIVNNEKEVIQARNDGYYPVINKSIDIFAILSSPGKNAKEREEGRHKREERRDE